MLDPSNVNRPLLAAVLQTGWGVSPPYLSWSPLLNRTEEDFRWAVGQTPFGPFSPSLSLSFADRAAGARNLLLSLLNDTVADAEHVLEAVKVGRPHPHTTPSLPSPSPRSAALPWQGYGGEEVLLPTPQRAWFSQRWKVLEYKLQHACSLLSHHDTAHALFFVRSARHDVEAMMEIAKGAAAGMRTTLRCFRVRGQGWSTTQGMGGA